MSIDLNNQKYHVIDNFLDEKIYTTLYDISNRSSYTPGWKSSKKTDPHGHWNINFTKTALAGGSNLADVSYIIPDTLKFTWNYIKEKYYPDVKITVKDTKQLTVDLFAKNKNWIELGSSNLNVGNLYKSDYDLLNRDWQKMAEKGKKICHVIGADKPRIRLIDDRYYFCFIDTPTIDFCNDRISDIDLPIYNEMFYWSPECGKMLIKQGHVIKKYLKQNSNSSIIKNDWNISDAEIEERKFKWHEEIGNCVYKRTLPHVWKTPKTLNEIHNEYLSWFWKDTNTDYFKNWNNGLEYIFQKVDKQLLDFQYNKKSKLKGCWSRLYDLGT